MRYYILLAALLASCLSAHSQSTHVTMTLTYQGNPLCFWDVTLKHGDVPLKEGRTDERGQVDFGYVNLLSSSVDASGYKKTDNGEKKWDVKGYMSVNSSGEVNFDFKPLVEETGMPGMVEVAWGLTLNDCAGKPASGGGSASSGGSETQPAEEESAFDKQQRENAEKREEFDEKVMSGEMREEGMQNSKAMHENKIANLGEKIGKRKNELVKMKVGSKDYSELSYEIRQLELERDLTQVKLDRVNLMIEKGNAPLNKAEKASLETREETLKTESDSLTSAQKAGNGFGKSFSSSDPGTSTPGSQPTSDESAPKGEQAEEDDDEALTIHSDSELAEMSTAGLKLLKVNSNKKIGSRKVSLTKRDLMKPDKIDRIEKEIVDLRDQIKRIDAELVKRKEPIEE